MPMPTLYSEYFQNYIERDLRQMASIRDLLQFEKFLRVLLNFYNVADWAGQSE